MQGATPWAQGATPWALLAIVIAGEAVFGLPFVIARVFRPTLLDVLEITNLQLGGAYSVYGLVAMAAYFPGGVLADRFQARTLMAAALLATASGGIVYASLPPLDTLIWLYGFWGLSTILLFWGAMIRATRQIGGDTQGRAFGILDGGRGLFAAILGSIVVAVFAWLLPVEASQATLEQRQEAFVRIIWIFTGMTALAAAMVFFALPDEEPADDTPKRRLGAFQLGPIVQVLKNPAVWLQAGIIVTAYTCYRGLDDVGLLARDTYGYDDVQAASVATVAMWVRPIAALGGGLLGDRIGGIRAIIACFALLVGANGVVAAGLLQPSIEWILFGTVACVALGAAALRGLYFAIFKEAGVSAAVTGTAVGVVSFIGYTPDIYMGPVNGYFTDTWPGALGHQYFFGFLTGAALLGLLCSVGFARLSRN